MKNISTQTLEEIQETQTQEVDFNAQLLQLSEAYDRQAKLTRQEMNIKNQLYAFVVEKGLYREFQGFSQKRKTGA